MGRHRPELVGWDDRPLRAVEETNPREWVLTILTDGRTVAPDVRFWAFGEIREAIRREIFRRTHDDERARSLAAIRAKRGLAALEEEGLMFKRGTKYWVPHSVRQTEYAIQTVRYALEDGIRVRIEIGPKNNPMAFENNPGSRKPAPIRVEVIAERPADAGRGSRRGPDSRAGTLRGERTRRVA